MSVLTARFSPLLGFTAAARGLSGAGTVLPFVMERQQQTNWCWSAVAKSVDDYYARPGVSAWTQCAIVDRELGGPCCGAAGASAACNVDGPLDNALTHVTRFNKVNAGRATSAEITTELGADRPMGVRVAWNAGGAHFLAVTGFDATTGDLDTDDPLWGPGHSTLANFPRTYQGGGSWTDSYFTNP